MAIDVLRANEWAAARWLPLLVGLIGLHGACFSAQRRDSRRVAGALATFTIAERIGHDFHDEVVHFDFQVETGADRFELRDEQGNVLPTQTEVEREGERIRGRVWTLLSAAPNQTRRLSLHAMAGPARPNADLVTVSESPSELVVSNDRLSVRVPRWQLTLPIALSALPPPLASVRAGKDAWQGKARWNAGGARVVRAHTKVVEAGPLRVAVEQSFTLDDGKFYRATIATEANQEAVRVIEDSNLVADAVALEFAFDGADHVYWQNQWNAEQGADTWALVDRQVPPSPHERVLFKLRPWSFWWLPNISEWAGFYRTGKDPFVGVLLLHPSRWSPDGWEGFEQTEMTAKVGPAGLALSLPVALKEGSAPLHREWALTAGNTTDFVDPDPSQAKLRRLLLKLSEFPLDTVKGFGLDHATAGARQSLLFGAASIQRVRAMVHAVPAMAAKVSDALAYIKACGGLDVTLHEEGSKRFYERYVGHQLQEALPLAFLGSSERIYAEYLAAAVLGLAKTVVDTFIEHPQRPAIGAYGPWFSETVTRLLLNYDLIADAGLLDREQTARVRAALVFGAQVLDHPDYWSRSKGLASANPNMSSSILLAKGLLALELRGHPQSEQWLRDASDEFSLELKEWVATGGAWIESPFYQVSTLDGWFLFAQGLRNSTGRDLFAQPQFKETLDYFGFLLTPPDPRFTRKDGSHPMVLPSIGNAFAGTTTPYNGWMASATRANDPAFSATQQFYWKQQGMSFDNAWRAAGFVLAETDPQLPSSPPAQLSRAFPGFGSVMRTSWTDPRASYVAHRTGPIAHHYDQDQGSFVLYAKGAALCPDWGNLYQPVTRNEAWFHNLVSFDIASSPQRFGIGEGALLGLHALPSFVDYSHGKHSGSGGQQSERHILFLKSRNALGSNYVLIRDQTRQNAAEQTYYWNLWCLAKSVRVEGNIAHFSGQHGVDLDLHMITPANARFDTDRWGWRQSIYTWRDFSEEQFGVHVAKQGDGDDFVALLDPRAHGQARAQVSRFGDAFAIKHDEGQDYVLFAPAGEQRASHGEITLEGNIALVRRLRNATVLAVLAGSPAHAQLGRFSLSSDGPTAVELRDDMLLGEASGSSHRAVISLPAGYEVTSADVALAIRAQELTLSDVPAHFRINLRRR